MHERIIEHINKHEGVQWCTFDEIADWYDANTPSRGSAVGGLVSRWGKRGCRGRC